MNNDNKTINLNYAKQLNTVLNEEVDNYKDIVKVEVRKNKVLTSGKYGELETINDELSTLLKKSINLEQKRTAVASFITRELGISVNSKLTVIIEHLPDDYYKKLSDVMGRLRRELDELRRLNELNNKLIVDAQRYSDMLINACTNQDASVEIDYGEKIKSKNNSKSYNNINNPKLFNRSV